MPGQAHGCVVGGRHQKRRGWEKWLILHGQRGKERPSLCDIAPYAGDRSELITSTLCRTNGASSPEKPRRFFQTTAGVQQRFFTGNLDTHIDIPIGFQVIDHHVRKVVNIDDDFPDSKARSRSIVISNSVRPATSTSAFGRVLVKAAIARSQTGGQNHGLHLPRDSNAICRSIRPHRLFPGNVWPIARQNTTDRCCPPVQPNDTIKLLNPRLWYAFTLASTSDRTFAKNWCELSC